MPRASYDKLFVTIIVTLCCAFPVAWVVFQIATHLQSLSELVGDKFRWGMVGRTVLFNGSASLIAILLALPVAIVLGRGGKFVAGVMWTLLPMSLLIPSIVYTYGWAQFTWKLHLRFEPASPPDVIRCIWSLAAWLWPIPAGLIGLALRRMDTDLQQHALLDGALWRVTLRQLGPSIAASFAVVLVLAMQEFAVYEPTGISVLSTEIRTVFDSGGTLAMFSQPAQPGTIVSTGFGTVNQAARAAAAAVTGTPMVLMVAVLSAIALWSLTRVRGETAADGGAVPQVLRARKIVIVLAAIVLLLVIVVPITTLIVSHGTPRSFAFIWAEYEPQTLGTILVASLTAILACALAFAASVNPKRWWLWVAIASFLIGGQFVAIALIRIYNRPWLVWVYDGIPAIVIAYMARFAWLALMSARDTHDRAFQPLRDMAAVDGATRWETTRFVIWPIAWPALLASAVLIGVLSMGEVPATVLLSPLRPPMLVPHLMTNIHTINYGPVIEASLLMVAMSMALGLVVVALVWVGKRKRGASTVAASVLLIAAGCSRSPEPDEIWLDTGVGPSQVVYPRGIAYSPTDDSFFVVDRRARVQHIDRAGQFLGDWITPAQRYGRPVGLSVGPDGNVYVPDTHYNRVIVYSPKGDEIRRWGSEGTGDGQFLWPTDIAFDAKGRVFVSEYGDHDRIQVFDQTGNYLYQFGSFGAGDGQFSRPQSMVIDKDTLYVADACNHRIVVFTIEGKFLRNMGSVGSDLGQFRFPYGLDIDHKGRLVVTEFGNNRVQWIDKDTGKGLRAWGAAGREPGELAYPWASAVDKKGRVMVVDSGNNRVQVLDD